MQEQEFGKVQAEECLHKEQTNILALGYRI